MDADPQCNMTERLLCDVIEQLDEEAERTGVVAELPGTSLLQVLEPRFNGDESFVNIDRIESVQIDTNLWLLRGDVSLNRLEDYIAEAHTQRFYNEKSHPIEGVIRERDTLFFVDYFRGRDKEELRMILKKFNDEMRNCFIRQQFF